MTELRRAAEIALDRELMQQALEALEEACEIVGAAWAWRDEKGKPSITALRERLAQPEQEPVARVDYGRKGNIAWLYGPVEPDGTLLYTAPPKPEYATEVVAVSENGIRTVKQTLIQKREWASLTGYQRLKFADRFHISGEAIEAIEQALKEKNCG